MREEAYVIEMTERARVHDKQKKEKEIINKS